MKILQIGCGGIGSWLPPLYQQAMLHEQMPIDTEIFLADHDTVEPRNLKQQNFREEDLFKNKAQVLGKKYNLAYLTKEIKCEKDIINYDMILLCVDNSKTRELVYTYCFKNGTFWIDLRAEGRTVVCYAKSQKNTPEKMIKTLNGTKQKASCQLPAEFEKNIIQYMPNASAIIGFQLLLNYLREDMGTHEIAFRV